MPADRLTLSEELPRLAKLYPKFLMNDGMAGAILHPPSNPDDCVFSKCRPTIRPTCEAAWSHAFLGVFPTVHNAGAPSAAGCTGSVVSSLQGR